MEGCWACAVRCKKVIKAEGAFKVDPDYGGPEYESIGSLGSTCGVSDIDVLEVACSVGHCATIEAASASDDIAETGGMVFLEGRHLLLDPRNASASLFESIHHESNLQGLGLMYRVIDTSGIFNLLQERDFGGQTCKLRLTIKDSFLPENAGDTFLCFDGGRLRLVEDGDADVQVRLDVAEFSSLLVGTVNFRSLYKYGLADISDPGYVGVVDRIFAVQDKPICTTPF